MLPTYKGNKDIALWHRDGFTVEEGINSNTECCLEMGTMKSDKGLLASLIQKSLIVWQINSGQIMRLEDRLTYVIRH